MTDEPTIEEWSEELEAEWEAKEAKAIALLPAWFTARMMGDNWYFGLLLTTNQILCISHISDIVQAADGSVWLNVDMLEDMPTFQRSAGLPVRLVSPTTRIQASVNAASIVAAFELADT